MRDGKGFKGSAYEADTRNKDPENAPLPWLTSLLPKFDYVEVYGGEAVPTSVEENHKSGDLVARAAEEAFRARLDSTAAELRKCIASGDEAGATELKGKLEGMLEGSGFEFDFDE